MVQEMMSEYPQDNDGGMLVAKKNSTGTTFVLDSNLRLECYNGMSKAALRVAYRNDTSFIIYGKKGYQKALLCFCCGLFCMFWFTFF